MVLYYTDRRPEDWHPRGFIENDTDEVLYFPNNEAWSPNEIVMQNIDTPFHRSAPCFQAAVSLLHNLTLAQT